MADPRHILMTTDCLGGVWDYSLTLARELAGRGCRVTLAVLGGPATPDQRAAAAAIPGLSLEESGWKLEWMPDCGDQVARSGAWLLELERALKPDLVHVNGYAHAALPFRAPVLCVAHSCVASWFAAVRHDAPPDMFEAYEEGVRAGLLAARAIAAPTRAMAAALAMHYGVARDVEVIPNGLDPEGFAPGAKELMILSAGRVWDEAKNIALLDRVAPRLGAPVVVAGEVRGPDGTGRLPEHAMALGRLPKEELRDLDARARIFCLPARYEPFGLAALEAGLSGCALVLGDIPSLREVWGDAALYVRPDDEDGLRRCLNGLLADPARSADMAHRARIRARRYTAASMADAYLDLYARLGQRAPRRTPRASAA